MNEYVQYEGWNQFREILGFVDAAPEGLRGLDSLWRVLYIYI